MFVPPLPPPVAAPPALAESNDKPVDKLAIFVTGNLKKTLLLLVFSPWIAKAAEPKLTVVIAHKSSVVGVDINVKVLPVTAVIVIEKLVVNDPPVETVASLKAPLVETL